MKRELSQAMRPRDNHKPTVRYSFTVGSGLVRGRVSSATFRKTICTVSQRYVSDDAIANRLRNRQIWTIRPDMGLLQPDIDNGRAGGSSFFRAAALERRGHRCIW